MLKLNKLADYATLIMVYMTRQFDDITLCNARDIAEGTHVNQPTVSKLLKILSKFKLIISVKVLFCTYEISTQAPT